MIIVKRVYEETDKNYIKVLVDRLQPRGVSKDQIKISIWAKDLAPSNELRKEFNHEENRFEEFKRKYLMELNSNEQAKKFKNENIVLLYAAKNEKYNNAVVLKEWLEMQLLFFQ